MTTREGLMMYSTESDATERAHEDGQKDSFTRAMEDFGNIALSHLRGSLSLFSTQDSDDEESVQPPLKKPKTQFNQPLPSGSQDSQVTLKAHNDVETSKTVVGTTTSSPSTLPPAPVGFWHSGLAETKKRVFIKYSWTLLILWIFVLTVLSIYWGVLFDLKKNLHNATIAIVDFDGQIAPYDDIDPVIGPYVVEAALGLLSKPNPLGFETHSPAAYGNDPMAVRVAVHNESLWGAIIINANATSLLQSAILSGNTSYDPFGACQIIYNQARDIESYNQYITPVLIDLAYTVSASFGRQWTQQVLSNSTYSPSTLSRSPQALSPAIGFSIFNLRPFDPPCAIPSISIGLIYLIIIAFFSFGFFIPTHMEFVLPNTASPHPPLKFRQLIIWRYLATLLAYLLLSLSYSLVSLAFQIPFSHSPKHGHWPVTEVVNNANYLGHGTFPAYWMLNFFGMAALGLACENMAMLLGTPWVALWLIFWVITNVSTSFYALEFASSFYKWGYAWPLRQIVYGSRTLLFGTRDQLGKNFGILFAWIVVGTILFVPACYFMRWKSMRERRRAAGGK